MALDLLNNPAVTRSELRGIAAKMSKILLVEDDQEVLSLLKDLLAELPTEIFTADSARSALQIMKEFSIDLVLLDIGLPDLDGFMLFQEIKKSQKNRDTQVIFLTGNIDPEKKVMPSRWAPTTTS